MLIFDYNSGGYIMINTCIKVKYLQATNNKGARLKAFDDDNHSITIPFPY